ncbi:sigma-70 family RNA polymerase sigma factor [Pseudoneobacillus sp. C159]
MNTVELVKAAQGGDDAAFLELFQRYEVDIYRTAYVFLKNKEDALDVVQETAYRSFKHIGTLNHPPFFKTWLIKIAMSCATDLLRKQKKVIYLKPDYTEWLGAQDEDLSLSITLKDLVEMLTDEEKHIVLLKYYYSHTFSEIAEILEIPLGTVKSIVYRSLDKLRKQGKGVGIRG